MTTETKAPAAVTENDLLPCPFCNAKAVFKDYWDRKGIGCQNSGCAALMQGKDINRLAIRWNMRSGMAQALRIAFNIDNALVLRRRGLHEVRLALAPGVKDALRSLLKAGHVLTLWSVRVAEATGGNEERRLHNLGHEQLLNLVERELPNVFMFIAGPDKPQNVDLFIDRLGEIGACLA